jgi:isoamylase
MLVRELHRNGIEVILDVVFNHTGEGCWGENNWCSWSQVCCPQYYLMSNGFHTNYTGCGNTMNANDSVCSEWIVECLRYWTCEMHVDGYRFDLASSLTRGGNGQINLHDPQLIKMIVQDPKLKHVKLIAEPWDCAWPDGFLVGQFPQGPRDAGPPRWAEWNGEFRDTARKFVKGDGPNNGYPDVKSVFANKLCGSSDLYEESGRAPYHSINFVTAHDGFTLKDLVSYNKKLNSCCGEESGEDNNHSWNCISDGQKEGDRQVQHLRRKQMKNLQVSLFLAHGTPMMTFGDEYGRSQNGCNNAWCQDKLSWFSWSACDKEEQGLFRFTRLLIALRKEYHMVFNRTSFATDEDLWFRTNWDDPYNYLCYILHASKSEKEYSGLLIAFNSGHLDYACDLPEDKTWYRLIDTNLESPEDFVEDSECAPLISGKNYLMAPYSCIVLKTISTFQEFQFLVHCDSSQPGEVVAIVGSCNSLGDWDPGRAVVCTTSAEEFPIWSSEIVQIPVTQIPGQNCKFDFKLLLRGEDIYNDVRWEEGENHEVLVPDKLRDNERVILKCAWGLQKVAAYLESS